MEELAALIDARLEESERKQLLAHIESCESCYEVFSETIRFREEEIGDQPAQLGSIAGKRPVDVPRRRLWLTIGSLAAAALLAVAIWSPQVERFMSGVRGASSDGSLAVGNLVADLPFSQDNLIPYDGSGWSRTRGLSDHLDETERSFRLGVRVVDLMVALRANEIPMAQRLLPEVAALADSFDVAEHLVATLREMQSRLEAGEPMDEVIDLAVLADGYATDLADGAAFELGKWAEAGRLAAASEEPEYFRRRKIRELPNQLEGAKLYADLSGVLESLRTDLAERPSVEQLDALASHFTRLVVEGGGSSRSWDEASSLEPSQP
jgi:hypothetical protein